jgi:hypothetical protein
MLHYFRDCLNIHSHLGIRKLKNLLGNVHHNNTSEVNENIKHEQYNAEMDKTGANVTKEINQIGTGVTMSNKKRGEELDGVKERIIECWYSAFLMAPKRPYFPQH